MRPPSDSMLSSLVGSCCLLLAVVDRSAAFLASSGGAGAAGHAVSSAGRGAVSLLGGRATPAALAPAAGGERQRRRGSRAQRLGMMAIDTSNNPITSKVYGRADAKGGNKTPDMNEEIAASGVGFFECGVSWFLGARPFCYGKQAEKRAWSCLRHMNPKTEPSVRTVRVANCNFVVRPPVSSTPPCR